MVHSVRRDRICARLHRGNRPYAHNHVRACGVRVLPVPAGLARNAHPVPHDPRIRNGNVHSDGDARIFDQHPDPVRTGAFHRRGGGLLHRGRGARTVPHRNAQTQRQGGGDPGDEGRDRRRHRDNARTFGHLRAGRIHDRNHGTHLPAVLRDAFGGGLLLDGVRTYARSGALLDPSP